MRSLQLALLSSFFCPRLPQQLGNLCAPIIGSIHHGRFAILRPPQRGFAVSNGSAIKGQWINLFRLGKPGPLGVVRVLWLCPEALPRGVGVLGLKNRKLRGFSILAFALLHYSMTPLLQRNSEIADTVSPLWGQIKATSSGREFFTFGDKVADLNGYSQKQRMGKPLNSVRIQQISE